MATLYRCKTPTNSLCPCGRVARKLEDKGLEFEEVRMPYLKRHRPEVHELTAQRWVPVLVDGEEVIHDSRRICEYLDRLPDRSAAA